MSNKDLIIGLHGCDDLRGGRYNVLSSFTVGLIKAFQKAGVSAYPTKECFEKGIMPNLTIGFNVSGYETWAEYMKVIPNIMWSVDSIFAQNFEAMQKFAQNPNFVLFGVTPCDKEPLSEFFPDLKYTYLPHATDLELWKKQDVEKEYDIVLFSSIKDYEKQLQELKETTPEPIFNLMMEMYNISLENPSLPFWDIYQVFKKHMNLNLDTEQYVLMFRSLSYIIMNVKKAQAVQKLSDFNLKIFGDGPWEKYISGKIEHLGACDLIESINVMNKSKIALHPHAMQLSFGLHERILNASAVETFVISSNAASIKGVFGDNMAYYNETNFEDLPEIVEYYLKNEEERNSKANGAHKIVEEEHTWDVRAKQILNMLY